MGPMRYTLAKIAQSAEGRYRRFLRKWRTPIQGPFADPCTFERRPWNDDVEKIKYNMICWDDIKFETVQITFSILY